MEVVELGRIGEESVEECEVIGRMVLARALQEVRRQDERCAAIGREVQVVHRSSKVLLGRTIEDEPRPHEVPILVGVDEFLSGGAGCRQVE